nr:MAG TPA: hypothetical protein [Caudoviricetes sp.]
MSSACYSLPPFYFLIFFSFLPIIDIQAVAATEYKRKDNCHGNN